MGVRKGIVVAVATAAASLAAAAPASAELTLRATGQILPNATTTSSGNVSVECVAQATVGVTTHIEACWIRGVWSGTRWDVPTTTFPKPGPADAAAGIVHIPSWEPLEACVTAKALTTDGEIERGSLCG